MSDTPVIYLVDDDPSVSKALTRLFRVAGYRTSAFATAQDFLNHPKTDPLSCLVLDVQLPDKSGLELQKELNERGWHNPIVFITGHGNVPMAVAAMRSGAVHFLSKPFENRDILEAVKQAIEQDRQAHAQADKAHQSQARIASLTPREREVFDLVALGMANKNIASRLQLSIQTVKLHRGRVMKKLQVESLADLVRMAERTKAAPAYL